MKTEDLRAKITDLSLKAKKRILSIAVILFTLFLTLIINGIQAGKIEKLNAEKAEQLKMNEVLREISHSEKTINLYKNIFGQKDAFMVMEAVSDMIKDSKVRLVSIKPEKEESYSLYNKHPFTLVIGAESYHAIGKFINKIEERPEVYFIDAMNMQLQEGAGGAEPQQTNKLIVNITLSIIEFKG